MARQTDEVYFENTYDVFRVVELIERKPYHEYTIEIYSIRQEVPRSIRKLFGYDFLFHGVKFFQYVTEHPAILDDKEFIDRMFEMSYKDVLGIRW